MDTKSSDSDHPVHPHFPISVFDARIQTNNASKAIKTY